MSQKSPEKGFDCLAFKWEVQSRIYEETKNLSPEEQIAYFRRKAAWFRADGRSRTAAEGTTSPGTAPACAT